VSLQAQSASVRERKPSVLYGAADGAFDGDGDVLMGTGYPPRSARTKAAQPLLLSAFAAHVAALSAPVGSPNGPYDPPMLWQRILIVTAVAGNALVLALPSLALLVWAWGNLWMSSDPFVLLALVVVHVVGIPVMLFSVLNLWCVRSAWVLRGDKRTRAIELGFAASAALAGGGLILSLLSFSPIPVLVLAPIAYATVTTLRHARAHSQRGGLCPHCDYDLTGLTGRVGLICPECGNTIGAA